MVSLVDTTQELYINWRVRQIARHSVRVVKEVDSKSTRLRLRRFESCLCRYFIFYPFPLSIGYFIIYSRATMPTLILYHHIPYLLSTSKVLWNLSYLTSLTLMIVPKLDLDWRLLLPILLCSTLELLLSYFPNLNDSAKIRPWFEAFLTILSWVQNMF